MMTLVTVFCSYIPGGGQSSSTSGKMLNRWLVVGLSWTDYLVKSTFSIREAHNYTAVGVLPAVRGRACGCVECQSA